ncbi:unnamed protein product [Orchesella dallaii]|uniref:FHF complex subunit HOOK-interacting protein C-terminal domain-containing protein n=1 Tax=Orchesella dallaii TaxID=48710 RepID=A0ABP1QUH6_9HEXA
MNLSWLKSNSNANSVREFRKHEPGVTTIALENHWKQARDVMLKNKDPESAITVISHFSQMITFLRLSRDDTTSWSSCKQFWIENRCSDKAIKWLHELGAQRCDKDDLKLVHTLQSLLELASEDGQLLGYEITDSSQDIGSWDGACSLSTLLLELCISVDPRISDAARKSFVLLIHLASKYPELENSISQEARLGVTNMTISGLSACFAQLPTFYPATSEQLQPFMQQLVFVDSVVVAATESLSSTIAECFSKNFLHAVMLPALTQSLHEEIAVVTSYLQTVCENVSHPLLIKSLISFVLTQLLTTLLHRMNHPSTAVTIATLSLLNVLLEFFCEDLWYELILRHLMPQNHLIVAQRYQRLPEVDFQEAALRFISLLPSSVTEVVGSDTVSHNFAMYAHSEVIRWSTIDSISFPDSRLIPDVSTTMSSENILYCLEEKESGKKSHKSVFPMWKYKYDGTDRLESSSTPCSLVNMRPNGGADFTSEREATVKPQNRVTPNVESEKAKEHREGTELNHLSDPLSAGCMPSEDRFTNIPLQPNNEEMNSIGIGMSEPSYDSTDVVAGCSTSITKPFDSVNDQSDGYSSMESGVMDNIASFGPFVDCLFNHLTNFTKLDTDVILMVTELVSTLASSRIPLISSLFLDHSLTLQPSFRSFLLILNRIRLQLDKSVRSQHQIIHEIWGQLAKDTARFEEPASSQQLSLPTLSDSNPFSSSFGENFTDNIRKTINSKTFVAAMSGIFRKSGVPSNNESLQDSVHSTGNQGYRYLAGHPGAAPAQKQEINKVMATRAIFFTHWLLELSAIAMQLCWKRVD